MESLELGKQGLNARASLGPDPGTSSGDTGGNNVGRPGPLPPCPFPELRAGFSWAAVGLTQLPWAPRRRRPGKWDTSGWPGGGGAAAHQTLLSPVPHPIRVCSAAWWERSPLNKPELLDNDKDEEGSPQAHPPPSPGSGLGCITFSHLSTHLVWNSWLQGRTRSSCRASKSLKQTTHLGGGHRSHFHTDG